MLNIETKKALIIEDDPIARKILERVVSSQGILCSTAKDGKEGWIKLNDEPDFDLVVTDIMMPDMDGRELTYLIREDGRFNELPIVIVSGVLSSEEIMPILEISPAKTCFFSKPIDSALLRKSLLHMGIITEKNMPRCLVVDDDRMTLKILEKNLSPYFSCQLESQPETAFENFKNALESGRPFDLVCLDVKMPRVDGIELLQALRELESGLAKVGDDATPVFMVSGVTEIDQVCDSLSSGCTVYLTKPIDSMKLESHVKRLGFKTLFDS